MTHTRYGATVLGLSVLLAASGCVYDPVYPDGGFPADGDADADGEVTVPGQWVTVPAGSFLMGSPEGEVGRYEHEMQHEVTLTRSFEMWSTEVTQAEFERLMGYNPSLYAVERDGYTCGPTCPVEQVSWHEAAAYANAASDKGGLARCYSCTGSGAAVRCEPEASLATPYDCAGYRLPTEAEWELAARAGSTTATPLGNIERNLVECEPNPAVDEIAWFCGNTGGLHTNPVGRLRPNAFGLYDMLGNVFEWTHDWFDHAPAPATDPVGPSSGPGRAMRGGSWAYFSVFCRSASRQWDDPEAISDNVGFRLVRTLE